MANITQLASRPHDIEWMGSDLLGWISKTIMFKTVASFQPGSEGKIVANIIRSRSKGEGDFTPTSKTLCFKCMAHGEYFVFIHGSRKYACAEHFREWKAAAHQMGDKLLSSEG